MEISQVRAKVRKAVEKKEEELEEDELGELNIVPYLDIVTILTIFMISMISAGIVLGSLNTTIPENGPASASTTTKKPETKPEDEPLDLVVAIGKEKIELFSLKNREIPMKEPKVFKRAGKVGQYCLADFECEYQKCDHDKLKCLAPTTPGQVPVEVYDYRGLNKAVYELAKKVWGKGERPRAMKTYQAIVTASDDIPYSTLISVMDTVRCKLKEADQKSEACLLPSESPIVTARPEATAKDSRMYDTKRKKYDPDTDALFADIVFGGGFKRYVRN